MRNYSNPKLKLLYLKQFFEECTDEDHPASMPEILAYLDSKGIHAERKGIYTDINYLEDFGMELRDISKEDKEGEDKGLRNRKYRLLDRDFEPSEIKLILDSVASSKFLSEKKSIDLMAKLEKLVSIHQRQSLKRQIKVTGRVKSMNGSVMYSVDTIHGAIASDKTIKFKYFHYNTEKEREYTHGGSFYEVSPWTLLYDNSNYYLLAYTNEEMRTFRVDRMVEVKQGMKERLGKEEFESFDLASFTKATFGMYHGKEEMVEMAFHNSLIGTVIDKFGREVFITPMDDTHFKITENVAVSPQFFGWIFGLGGRATILGPKSVIEQMREMLEKVGKKYE